MTYEVYNIHTNESEFEGSWEECQDFIASEGGGWAALDVRPLINQNY
jgi:hypothetical protein